ncbi:MAG: M48 family metallopeptidase [Suilimivivens sp.]
MQYQLIKSKRKTIAISFDGDGNLIVKAPYFVRNYEVEAFVRSKADWIEATAIRLKREKEKRENTRLKLESGDMLPFLGEQRVLTVIREDRKRAKVNCAMERLLVFVPYDAGYEYRREALEKWYRKEASVIIGEKAEEYASRLNVAFKDIHIKDQKSRWGSCSSKGNLNFNWRLVMAPESVLDYVVIHELCHLRYMDHSEHFWNLVSGVCPAYRQYRKWLKENGESLYLF